MVLSLALLCPQVSRAQKATSQLHIAAAADLQPVLPALAAVYERQTGVHITPSFGSSATLTQQLQNGEPAGLFLSADCTHPQELIAAKLAEGPEPSLYARGILVLWARKDSPAQPLSLEGLRSARILKVAVANDLHAPYGQAATAAIRALKLQDTLTGKLVVGENIAQTAQFALTGNAQAGFISRTLAVSPAFAQSGSFILVPPVYPAIQQCGVVLLGSPERGDAERFLRWLVGPQVQSKLAAYGLEPAQ